MKIRDFYGVVHAAKEFGYDAMSACGMKWALSYPESWKAAIPTDRIVVEVFDQQTTCVGCLAEE